MMKIDIWKTAAKWSSRLGGVTFLLGLYKMFIYEIDGEYWNDYVGGDAYNFIINSNHATSYFVLTTMFVLATIGFLILGKLEAIQENGLIIKKAQKLAPVVTTTVIEESDLEDLESEASDLENETNREDQLVFEEVIQDSLSEENN